MAYVRTVKTASGAMAVQIVYSSRRGSREIEHIGSAHTEAEVELLKAAARQRLAAGQGELELGHRDEIEESEHTRDVQKRLQPGRGLTRLQAAQRLARRPGALSYLLCG